MRMNARRTFPAPLKRRLDRVRARSSPRYGQAAFKIPSCVSAVTPSSSPISSAILPFSTRSTVVPVKCIFRPDAAGSEPARKSPKAGPVWVPPPSHRPTT